MTGPLLLLSNSTAPGQRFLEHALGMIAQVLAGRKRLLFVPFADSDPERYTSLMQEALMPLGVRVEGLDGVADASAALAAAEAVFVGGGNSFRLLRALRERQMLSAIGARVGEGLPYLGASAGANLACPTIRTTNDMPICEAGSLDALGLIPFQINPHYVDPDPGSVHMGETRARRLDEFLEVNDVPVLGLREGSWLHVAEARAILGGVAGARLFRRGAAPQEMPVGTDCSWLLDVRPRYDA